MSKNMRYLPTGQDFDNRHFPKSRGSATATMQHVNRTVAPKRQMAPQQGPMVAPDDDADDGTYVSQLRKGGQPKRVKRANGGPIEAMAKGKELTSGDRAPGNLDPTTLPASPLAGRGRVKRAIGGPIPGGPPGLAGGAPPGLAQAAANGAPVGSDNPMQRATLTMPVQDAQKIAKNLVDVGKQQAQGGAPGAPAGPAGALSMGRPGMPGAMPGGMPGMPGAGAPPMGGGMPGIGAALGALGGGAGKPMGLRKGGAVKAYAKGGDVAQDKAMVRKGVRQHETQEHGGKHATLKLRHGGPVNDKPRIPRAMKPVAGRPTSAIGIGVRGAPKAKMPVVPKATNSYGGPEGYGVRQSGDPNMPEQGLRRGGKVRG